MDHPARPEADPLLDRFMPAYEVVERHHVGVAAPAEITLTAACEMDLPGAIGGHILMHIAAVLHGPESAAQLLPHY